MTDGAEAVTPAAAPLSLTEALEATRTLITRTLRRADSSWLAISDLLARAEGKLIRARLLLAAAQDAAGQIRTDAVQAAAALEILHLATLVHDDVIDDAPTRRGQPSVQSRFGQKSAVITGDYLLTLCLSLVAGLPARQPNLIPSYAAAMSALVTGEMKQHQHNRDLDLRTFAYLRIIAGKTAALFSLALHVGATLSGEPEPVARCLARAGFAIGMCFQLVDDCLDYETSADIMRKETRHDLGEGVITLPLIYALAADPAISAELRRAELNRDILQAVAAEVVTRGHVGRAHRLADRYADRARRLLARDLNPPRRDTLLDLTERIQNRRQ